MERGLCVRKIIGFMLIIALSLLTGCTDKNPKSVKMTYLDLFDTVTLVTVYEADEADVAKIVQETYERLNDVFDAYAPHDGIDGLYRLNNAEGEWTSVDADLLNLLLLCKTWHAAMPQLDITRGALYDLWRTFREDAGDLPTADELAKAATHGGWENVEIDAANARVRLNDPLMRIDLGAVAKGYAAGQLATAFSDAGFTSFLIDAGGNVVTGARAKPFVIGVTNPRGDGLVLKLSMQNMAAVSSGDYQRYRDYEGVRYHHIIDIATLYPADHDIAQVTVVLADSGYADFLSTTIFLMDYDTGRAFADENGLAVVWVTDDGEIRMTDSAREMVVK